MDALFDWFLLAQVAMTPADARAARLRKLGGPRPTLLERLFLPPAFEQERPR